MAITTIQLSQEMKERIASFGSKSDTYEIILDRIYSLAEFLMSDEGSISIEEARKELDEKWPE